jgi:serine/threonine protein kinase
MRDAKSPFITKLLCSFRDEHHYCMAMEWASGGDVFSFISEDNRRMRLFREAGEIAIRFVLGCTILGLEYLHSKDFAYLDLKPENLLVFEDGYVKLTDFGLAKKVKSSEDEKSKMRIGTPTYFAPEMLVKTSCGKLADLWALGILAY